MAKLMKKHILVGALQYIGALVLLACTVLFILGFRAGKLPFMDSDYLDAREDAENVSVPEIVPEDNTSVHSPVQETAATYIAALSKADKDTVPFGGLYSDGCSIVVRSLSGVSLTTNSKPALYMGFMYINGADGNTVIYDSRLNDVSSVLSGLKITLNRDESGNPLFFGESGYVYLQNGSLVSGVYDKNNLDKGVTGGYPSYLSGYDKAYTVFEENGLFGLKRLADNEVLVPAEYKDVFGVSEGISIAVDEEKRLHLYNTAGKLISKDYFAPEQDSVYDIGYYFVRNGITRARDAAGNELILRADGNILKIPTGFKVLAYSDGAVLLQGDGCYGFMSYTGKWITSPDYKDAQPFNEGLAVVCNQNGQYGMINLKGEVVVPCLFDSITSCSDGVILAYSQKFGYYLLNKVA